MCLCCWGAVRAQTRQGLGSVPSALLGGGVSQGPLQPHSHCCSPSHVTLVVASLLFLSLFHTFALPLKVESRGRVLLEKVR